ncbi:sugar phosphate isomerase/epimerase family protein [Alkalibacillus aidingensis]|uniref:sugar phosphate isomerase/epimerase family protein n=1 Tax=Alkalibacillus aidingensis TaxID=2747607 RepID=UPI001661685A|nr:sugar phosphate isomerase/epimerase family protein [Alkalibacillus aidingensis]
MFNQLALNTNTYHGFSLEEALKGAHDTGFKQVEIAAVRDHTAHVTTDFTEAEFYEVLGLLKKYDLTCVGVSAHSNVMTDEGIRQLVENIDLAEVFNCQYVVTATGDSHGDTDVIDDINSLVKNLQPVVEKCERLGKTLVIETHGNNFATGESLMKLVHEFNNRVKINYDTANVIFYGHQEPYEDLEKSINHVEFIHLKDKLGEHDTFHFPAIGDGYLDYTRLFNILKQGNYTGPISVEVEFTPEGPQDLEEVNQAVKRSYDFLRQKLI